MRALLAAALLSACAGSSPPRPVTPPATPSRVVEATFHSDALGVDKRYLVYLPGGYDAAADRRYPVVYMLHGLGGDETNWTQMGGLAETADRLGLQAIVVMPDGDTSFYANSVTPADYDACAVRRPPFLRGPVTRQCVRAARYEDYVVRDLVGHVDATYRTIAERRGRGIGGLSMGGFGALMLAMRHRDVFAAAASHSGVDALLYVGPHPYEPGKVLLGEDVARWGESVEPIGGIVRAVFGPDLANWRAHDPAYLARQLRDGELAIYIDCGTEDDFALQDGAQYLHEVLGDAGVKHAFHLLPGPHNFSFWRDRIDDSLAFFADALAR